MATGRQHVQSTLSLALMLMFLAGTLTWHEKATGQSLSRRLGSLWRIPPLSVELAGRRNELEHQEGWQWWSPAATTTTATTHWLNEGADNKDDDVSRDGKCKDFLSNFLNGTTDIKDTCEALQSASRATGCQQVLGDDTKKDKNRQNDPNDVGLDDVYEEFECCMSISTYYEKHCVGSQLDAMKLFGIVAVLVVCGLAKSLIQFANVPWIPDAGACIVVGAVVGGVMRLSNENFVKNTLSFDNDLFLHILLPPIIFAAAIEIDKHAFRRHFYPIMTFAVVGTAFSAVAIGLITYKLSHTGPGLALPLLDSLVFGALMSSIDPVATLSILTSVGCHHGDTLYTLVFGESLLNDGVSIVLFESLARHVGSAEVVDAALVRDIVLNFVWVVTGSVVIGGFFGGLCTLYFWTLEGKHTPVSEVALFFCWALLPYYVADGLKFSGIISIMAMGFFIDFYVVGGLVVNDHADWAELMEQRRRDRRIRRLEPLTMRMRRACIKAFSGRGHLTSHARHHVGFVADVISSLMETAIFAYLGLFLFTDKRWTLKLVCSAIFACLTSRAAMVIGLCMVINFFVWADIEPRLWRAWRNLYRQSSFAYEEDPYVDEERVYLDKKTQMILFSAGVRGAVSYALAVNIPVYDSVSKHGSSNKAELKTMCSSAIVVLLFALGAMTHFLVKNEPSNHAGDQHVDVMTTSLMGGQDAFRGAEDDKMFGQEQQDNDFGRSDYDGHAQLSSLDRYPNERSLSGGSAQSFGHHASGDVEPPPEVTQPSFP